MIEILESALEPSLGLSREKLERAKKIAIEIIEDAEKERVLHNLRKPTALEYDSFCAYVYIMQVAVVMTAGMQDIDAVKEATDKIRRIVKEKVLQ